MQITTKSRYGLRAMVELAANFEEGPISLREIAEKQDISNKYLEQIVPFLKSADLVRSIQGSKGGYVLTRDPESINLFEILQVLEGQLKLVDCVDDPEICERKNKCATRDLWVEISEEIADLLASKSLEQLADDREKESRKD